MNQQLFNSTNFATSSSRSFFSTEFRAYSGNGTIEFHGNVNWTGPGGGYCMLDFNYHQDASTVNFSYQVSTATVSNTDSYYGNTTKSQEPVYDYRSYTFSFSQTFQSGRNANLFSPSANELGFQNSNQNAANFARHVGEISNKTGFGMDVTQQTFGYTRIGSDIGCDIAYKSSLLIKAANSLKYLGWACIGAGIAADVTLSVLGEQSWKKTTVNAGVSLLALSIGDPAGLIIGLGYTLWPEMPLQGDYVRPFGELQDHTMVIKRY